MEQNLTRSSTTAIRYGLGLWEALTRYRDDGRLEIDNNAAERPLQRLLSVARTIYLLGRTPEAREQLRSLL